MKTRKLMLAALTACLAISLVAVPTASAQKSKSDQARSAQKSPSAKQAKTLNNRQLQRRLNRTNRSVRQSGRGIQSLVNAVNGERKKSGEQDAQLSSIFNNVLPAATAALTQLGAGLTQVGAGLKTLGDAYQAVEYGVGGLVVTGAGAGVAGTSGVSSDIPDDGNPAVVNGNGIIVSGGAAAINVDLRADIRSNEADNTATGGTGPVGQAGGFLMVRNADTGVRVPCAGAPNPPGIFGTQPGASIVTPSGTVTNLPLVNIVNGKLRTDTAAPTAASTGLLPAACTFTAGAAGETYVVDYTVNFVDIPTSTSPGPRD
jgi:hypothetical protein